MADVVVFSACILLGSVYGIEENPPWVRGEYLRLPFSCDVRSYVTITSVSHYMYLQLHRLRSTIYPPNVCIRYSPEQYKTLQSACSPSSVEFEWVRQLVQRRLLCPLWRGTLLLSITCEGLARCSSVSGQFEGFDDTSSARQVSFRPLLGVAKASYKLYLLWSAQPT